MRLSLCNEVIADGRDFAEQCVLARAFGYEGLEVAPFTLSDEPQSIGADIVTMARRAAADAGIAVSGLHWLLVKPEGLSITSPDAAVRERTRELLRRLIGLCGELGGQYLVHGSPAQRYLPDGPGRDAARAQALEVFAFAGEEAARAGVVYCVEPLAPPAANFVNTVAEAAEIVRRIDNPALRTMIDCSAASNAEAEPLAELAAKWLPTGLIAHVQVNDRNRRGPGQGDDPFAPFLRVLYAQGYAGWIAAEPFDYVPDGVGCAARAIGYIQGILEGIS